MYASGKRRPPTAGSISQGLHTSAVACAYLANDVGQKHAASAKACTHQSWHVCIGWGVIGLGLRVSARQHRPTTGSNNQGLHALTMACVHRLGDIDRGLRALARRRRPMISNIIQGLHTFDVAYNISQHQPRRVHWLGDIGVAQRQIASAKAYTHLTCLVRFKQLTSANGRRHRPGDIGRGLPTSVVACAHRSVDVVCGLPELAVAYADRSAIIRLSLPASLLACTYRSTDIGRGQPASSLACTQRLTDIGRELPLSSVACTHWSADVGCGPPA
ncbi:hypothetical protein H5410_014685 [Solanum commersonii]|uniref:Uncharacterized protein n=1 Tax=Solanum commersonii TaxID=4109 RepID=A0A9J5ZRJ9_SOLCO|nr:hypothetical protein H5410_014685 [Solanum commersonii]